VLGRRPALGVVYAARNILAAGHAVWAQHRAPAASTKQEPTEATRTGSTPARAQ
jgi:hypothetical protein